MLMHAALSANDLKSMALLIIEQYVNIALN